MRRRSWPAVVALVAWSGCSSLPESRETLVSLTDLDPTIRIDMRYAGANNVVGAPLEGYEMPVCLLTRPAAIRLVQANRMLHARGLALVVYDCYRPQRAVDQLVRWAADATATETKADHYPYVPKSELLARGYIVDPSSHSRGSAVDAGLLRLYPGPGAREWQPVDMGTPFGYFDPRSRIDSPFVSQVQHLNRLRLLEVMERNGFRNDPSKWWHFTLKDEPYPDTYFDFAVE